MTIREVIQNHYGKYDNYEVYVERGQHRLGFHTDRVKELDRGEYDYDGEQAIEWELMNKDDYSTSILANSSVEFGDIYNDEDKILVIKIRRDEQ